MTFSSISFIYLYLPLASIIFRLTPAHRRVACLTLLSWCYYLLASVPAALILAANCLLDFVLLSFLELYLARCPDKPVGYLAFAAKAVVVQVLVMAYSHWSPGASLGGFVYTATLIGYLWDHSRGKAGYFRSFWDYALFTTFFPAILSGPIERSKSLLPQFKQPRRANADDVRFAAERLIEGTVKKVLLADNLAILVNTAYADPAQFSGLELAFAAVAYALQIYCDFSAYSDMAIGSARLFGITLMENFHAPYMAQSSKEFWHRWHISLSTWFRDYLYFPLGGSRKGKARTYINVLIVFALSGLWHGAAMKYVLWGLLFGVFQVIGGLLTPAKQRLCAALHIPWDAGWLQIIRVIITFGLSTFAWIFFRADSALQACAIIKRIVTAAGACFPLNLTHLGLTERALNVLAVSLIGLVLTDIIGDRFPLREKLLETVWLRYAVWVILLAVTAVCGAYGTGFNPQEFVYFQF